jgi:DNA-binding response OmpR family regulator
MTVTNSILIVDDDELTVMALTLIVEKLGFHAFSFTHSTAALAAMKGGEQVLLALLDIMMPELDGYELLAELRKLPQFHSTPVIMVTAKDQETEVLEGYRSGADYYIRKPFTRDQIEAGIRLYLKRPNAD